MRQRRRPWIWLVVMLLLYLFSIGLKPLTNRTAPSYPQPVLSSKVVNQHIVANQDVDESNIFFHPVDDIILVSSKQKHLIGNHDKSPSYDEAETDVGDATSLIYILYWTSYFGRPGLEHGSGTHPFHGCPVSNCFITDDKSYLNQSEAIIFHAPDFDAPPPRNLNQKWIFFNAESPQLYPLKSFFLQYRQDFNLTMTYRRDSDIYRPYGYMLPLAWNEWRPSADYNFAQGKTKKVAWLVSHGWAPSQREQYAHELSRYIDVDIYGQRGTLTCEKNDACWQMINSTYKFYLSFENTFCKDYLTEKVFAYMTMNLVPVVMGLANYSAILPHKSYIDVRNFDSPHNLAEYLKLLDQNDDLYIEYFTWRQKWRSQPRDGVNYCGMCQVLQSNRGQVNIYPDLEAWWKPVCMEPDIYFAGHVSPIAGTP